MSYIAVSGQSNLQKMFLCITCWGGSRVLWKRGVARSAGVPDFREEGSGNLAFGFYSFLRNGSSFITNIRCTIKEINMQVKFIM